MTINVRDPAYLATLSFERRRQMLAEGEVSINDVRLSMLLPTVDDALANAIRSPSPRASTDALWKSNAIRLDLGAGRISPHGFTPVGRDHGSEIFPLSYADESVDVIRASHVLEHFPHAEVPAVIGDWVRALKKGGTLKIAVPDFAKIAEGYLSGKHQPTEGYLLGGQTDANDYHKAMFDRDKLRQLLAGAGLVLTQTWQSEIEDCAAYPISLNLEARKPHVGELKVVAAMSVPRLGFMDNYFSCIEACLACNVRLKMNGGAFWGQALTKSFENILDQEDADLILTVDYNSIFTPKHLAHLIQYMMLYPEIDALAAVQSSRHIETALFTVRGMGGDNEPRIPRAHFDSDTTPVTTAHFGLTLIRTSKLKALPKPWFHSIPSPKGEWHDGDGHVDEDINFWRKWEAAGNTLHLANRVAIGHAELMCRWPDHNLEVFYQSMKEFRERGVPSECWV